MARAALHATAPEEMAAAVTLFGNPLSPLTAPELDVQSEQCVAAATVQSVASPVQNRFVVPSMELVRLAKVKSNMPAELVCMTGVLPSART